MWEICDSENLRQWIRLEIRFKTSSVNHSTKTIHHQIIIRNSSLQMFFKIGVLKIVAKFTGRYRPWMLFFNKVADLLPAILIKKAPAQLIFKETYFVEHLQISYDKISILHQFSSYSSYFNAFRYSRGVFRAL